MRDPGLGDSRIAGTCVAAIYRMRRTTLYRERTTLDVMDHVLNKGVIIDAGSEETDEQHTRETAGIVLFGIDARVNVATNVDPTLTDTGR